ncbi:hypothetical protein [Neobacillus sp.]|uniref:hypothetical protein n=1 Tax=Neobacillus sp. TaxID=2675273 RepID=UPI00289B4B44|nr:hypothetical protein [Neobacillus sp.]
MKWKLVNMILPVILLFVTSACSPTTKSTTQPESQKVEEIVDNSQKEKEFQQALQEYIDENFGIKGLETSWYSNIKGYEVHIEKETVVKVRTDLAIENTKIQGLTGAFLGFLNDKTNTYRADKVVLVDMNGNIILEKETILKP